MRWVRAIWTGREPGVDFCDACAQVCDARCRARARREAERLSALPYWRVL